MGVLKRRVTATTTTAVKEVAVPEKKVKTAENALTMKSIHALHEKYYAKKSKKVKGAEVVKEKVASIQKEKAIKKEEVKKSKGPTIDDIWVKVLSAAVGKRLTDKAIAAQMEQACPGHKYSEASVAGHRSGYNCGRFPIQQGVKPKVRLEKYEMK